MVRLRRRKVLKYEVPSTGPSLKDWRLRCEASLRASRLRRGLQPNSGAVRQHLEGRTGMRFLMPLTLGPGDTMEISFKLENDTGAAIVAYGVEAVYDAVRRPEISGLTATAYPGVPTK